MCITYPHTHTHKHNILSYHKCQRIINKNKSFFCLQILFCGLSISSTCAIIFISEGRHPNPTLRATRNIRCSAWVPGHSGIEDNERADCLANRRARVAMIGPEPFCYVPRSHINSLVSQLAQNKATGLPLEAACRITAGEEINKSFRQGK